MQKILNTRQMKEVEAITLAVQVGGSQLLMERACDAFLEVFNEDHVKWKDPLCILCGTGHNGGDGLLIARKLSDKRAGISVFIFRSRKPLAIRFEELLKDLKERGIGVQEWQEGALPVIEQPVIIDALLGIGLNKALEGELSSFVQQVNELNKYVIAVDIPTGMPVEGSFTGRQTFLKAQEVISFHAPKLSFFFPESQYAMGRFTVVDIGLDQQAIAKVPGDYALTTFEDVVGYYRKRSSFGHKGTYGKALIVAGDTRTLGAALLCGEACLYAGAGLTSVCIPDDSRIALNIRCPEIMFIDSEQLKQYGKTFNAIGIGSGLGGRIGLLESVLSCSNQAILLDADALTYLAAHPEKIALLPENAILTPHMKEFDRLFGKSDSWYERLQLAREKAKEHQLIIVLKNRYTFVVLPSGSVRINPSGNPAMASGGMGDVLSGIITALLAQGYPPEHAAVLGVFVHGHAGDECAREGRGIVTASQVSAKVPFVLNQLAQAQSLP